MGVFLGQRPQYVAVKGGQRRDLRSIHRACFFGSAPGVASDEWGAFRTHTQQFNPPAARWAKRCSPFGARSRRDAQDERKAHDEREHTDLAQRARFGVGVGLCLNGLKLSQHDWPGTVANRLWRYVVMVDGYSRVGLAGCQAAPLT